MTELADLSATEALAMFRDRRLSPVELTQAVIDRAQKTEPTVNAFTYTYFEAALEAAQEAESKYMGKGQTPRPLEGICVAVKDSGHIAGLPTSSGSLFPDGAPQPATSPINERILQSGAIVHARSATPEYSCAAVTHSRKWGVTRNPWNPKMTPGGSTGGGAAALAAGSAMLASGSDIGGSIRIPAACCGVVGYKPPRGRNPVDAPFNLDPFCHTGPLARSVEDVRLFQNQLCGPHPADPYTLPRYHLEHDASGLRGVRIALSLDLGFFEVDPEIRAATMAAADLFRDLGAVVEEISLPWDWTAIEAALIHLRALFGASIVPERPEDWDLMTPYARAFAEAGLQVTPLDHYRALTIMGEVGKGFGAAMQGHDLLICPTTAIPAVDADFDHSTDALSINGREVEPMLGWVLTAPFNILGSCPVLSVPMGLAANGVPLGLQIVGHGFADQMVFRAGYAFEAASTPLGRPIDGNCMLVPAPSQESFTPS